MLIILLFLFIKMFHSLKSSLFQLTIVKKILVIYMMLYGTALTPVQ